MRSIARLVVVALVSVVVVACAAPGPKITANSNPGSDFSSFSTYNFAQPLGTDRPGGARTQLSVMLVDALSREMESRGYTRSDDPDILVNVFVNTDRRMDVRQVPTATTYHGYRRGRYSTWGTYDTQIREYTQGTLAVDIVDARQNMLAWDVHAERRLAADPGNFTVEQVNNIIGLVMAEYPYIAGPR